ncbi:nitrilase-related carbon-nitrogen hydrolase [Mediannikoviicoccus vaginalis]|uniref:nitrilase-related carbon-nitrogen hydrolase n=1 Tax=Mediannikoviicoccus vaginalis TaxID=2899727 RepID=UPI001F212660|nr:nitrilase-related carbon-nitrogen hydrolase [Mediannikoviicoccus vaginalis]
MIIKIPIRENYDDIENNLKVILNEIEDSSEVDLILFNEGFLQGFEAFSFEYKNDVEIARFQNSMEIASIKDTLKEKNMAVGFGYYENFKGGLYNSFIVLGKNGKEIINYRTNSTHWKAKNACADYREGERLYSFRVKDSEVGVVSYFDLLDETSLSKLINMDAEVDLFCCMGNLSKEEFKEREKEFLKISEIFDKPILLYLRDKTCGLVLLLKHGKVLKEDNLKMEDEYIFTI